MCQESDSLNENVNIDNLNKIYTDLYFVNKCFPGFKQQRCLARPEVADIGCSLNGVVVRLYITKNLVVSCLESAKLFTC